MTVGGTNPSASRTWRWKSVGPTRSATIASVALPTAITASCAASSFPTRLRGTARIRQPSPIR